MAFEIVITKPCTDSPGCFIAESSFGCEFNMGKLCAIIKLIDGAKCSDDLGVAKLDYQNRTVILYRSGGIDLRKIRDADDTRAAMGELEAILRDAFEGGASLS